VKMRDRRTSRSSPRSAKLAQPRDAAVRRRCLRATRAAVLAIAIAGVASCGESGKGLIPSASAGPLKGDFEEVARAAEEGNGSCSATEDALMKTERDFSALPASVDAGLRHRLSAGIANLRSDALARCRQPHPQSTVTTTTPKTTTTQTTPSTPTHTETTPAPAKSTPTPPAPEGGGTAAPGTGGEAAPGSGEGAGETPEEGGGEGNGRHAGAGNGEGGR
jgi:hypothetical protein